MTEHVQPLLSAAQPTSIETYRNTMPREDFLRRYGELKEAYGLTRQTAGARAEQSFAELFAKSGWTQDRIAEAVGMKQGTVARLLTFGRFLDFIPMGINADFTALRIPLTERRFRKFWSETKNDDHGGNDRQRYAATWRLIEAADDEKASGGRKPPRDFGPLREAIAKKFGDGKWHLAEAIAKALDIDEETLADVIDGTLKFKNAAENFGYQIEQKPFGRSRKYRFFRTDRNLSLHRALEELGPILEGLEEQARKNVVTVSVPAIARLAAQLKALMNRWDE